MSSCKFFWDYVETFKNSSDQDVSRVEELDKKKDFEYKYVAYKWASTFSGSDLACGSIKKTLKRMACEGSLSLERKIIRIDKIYHRLMYSKFIDEMKKILTS